MPQHNDNKHKNWYTNNGIR